MVVLLEKSSKKTHFKTRCCLKSPAKHTPSIAPECSEGINIQRIVPRRKCMLSALGGHCRTYALVPLALLVDFITTPFHPVFVFEGCTNSNIGRLFLAPSFERPPTHKTFTLVFTQLGFNPFSAIRRCVSYACSWHLDCTAFLRVFDRSLSTCF